MSGKRGLSLKLSGKKKKNWKESLKEVRIMDGINQAVSRYTLDPKSQTPKKKMYRT